MSSIITLRPLELSDTEHIVKWRNKKYVRTNLYSQDEITTEQHIHYFESMVSKGLVRQFVIVVENNNNNKTIGTTFIKNIDAHSRKAEFGIFIGEDDARGKGYGYQATKQTIDYAFRELRLNRIYLTVFADNIAAIKAYQKSGFTLEGIMKEDYLRGESFVDVALMSILRSNWKGQNSGTDKSN